ncbi:MAG: class I SAM-dependent methyltransferase [Methanolinea sp.]|jgi:SAM-dependent methyltransferase|nr:class I SAM-dependent methyltransferase [Methanolinea sp.]
MKRTEQVHGVMGAAQYDHLIRAIVPGQSLLLSTIIDNLPVNCKKVLDLGCGTGILTGMIGDAFPGAEIIGIDLSSDMLEVASDKSNSKGVSFIAQDLREPWPEGKFDAIVSSLCLHHVPPSDRRSVAQRAVTALNPAGRFICGDIFRAGQEWEERMLTVSWVRAMKREGAPNTVIEGMIRQRAGRLPELSTISDFQKSLLDAGFERSWVPFTSGFVGLVAGEI